MSTVLCKDGVKGFSFVGPAFLLIPTHRHREGPRVPRVSEARILSVILNVYQCYLFLADVEVYLTHQKKWLWSKFLIQERKTEYRGVETGDAELEG